MAFESDKLFKLNTVFSDTGGNSWQYSSDIDSLSHIKSSGYFNGAIDTHRLKEGDLIYLQTPKNTEFISIKIANGEVYI